MHPEVKNFLRLTNPLTQDTIAGVVLFCTVGIYNAVSGLGAGGGRPSSQHVAAETNAILYALFTITGVFGGSVMNTVGPKITLALGAFGYPVYVAGLWYYDTTGNSWFPLLGGAILGISAGWLWTTVGFIQFAYAEEKDKGKYIAWDIFLLALGSTVGACISFGINYQAKGTSGVPLSVYVIFIIVMLCAVGLTLLTVVHPSKIVRKDGRHIALFKPPSYKEEILGTFETLKDPRILLMLLPMFATEIQLGLIPTLNAYLFNLRSRSLNDLLWTGIQLPTCYIAARVLDNERYRRKLRGYLGICIATITFSVGYILVLVQIKHYNIDRNNTPPGYDWTDPHFLGMVFAELFFGFSYAFHHMLIQWVLSSMTNDPQILARYSGMFKGIDSGGVAIAYGLESALVPYIDQAIWAAVIMWTSIPLLVFVVYKYTTDTNYFKEAVVIPPKHVEDEMREAGLVEISSKKESEVEITLETESTVERD